MTHHPRHWRPCVVIASDADCENVTLCEHAQTFLRGVQKDRRQIFDWAHKRAVLSAVALVDQDGNPATLVELSDEDFERFDEWIRGWIVPRPPHLQRRVSKRSMERVRLVLTLLRMAFPRESQVWGRSWEEIGMPFSPHDATTELY